MVHQAKKVTEKLGLFCKHCTGIAVQSHKIRKKREKIKKKCWLSLELLKETRIFRTQKRFGNFIRTKNFKLINASHNLFSNEMVVVVIVSELARKPL